MKHITKKKISKLRLLIIFSAVFVLLLTGALLFHFLLDGNNEEKPEVIYPEILEGEALKYNQTLAYPELAAKDISLISIKNKTGTFHFLRPESNEEGVVKNFEIYYEDSEGNTKMYYPEICEEDYDFEYESLYAVEMGDGFKMIPKLTYLCSVLEVPYFDERIELSKDPSEREKQLDMFSLSEDKAQYVSFIYTDAEGNEKTHKITIGDASLSGRGYYFMVDGREYVYSTSSDYYSFALLGVASYVQPYLVAAGISDDNGFGPYLTKNYYQWLGETHNTEGDRVEAGSRVIVYADVITPTLDTEGEDTPENGYIRDGYSSFEISLSELIENGASYDRLVKALTGREIGEYSEDISVTLTASQASSKILDFDTVDTLSYKYVITHVEGILLDNGDVTKEGTAVGDNNLVKVTYTLYVNGENVYDLPAHAVIDLSREEYGEEFVNKIRASSVGKLSENIELSIDYTKENSVEKTVKYVIEEIISIYGQNGYKRETVDENSIVSYRYYFEIDGKKSGESITAVLDLKNTEEKDFDVKQKLLGLKTARNLKIAVRENVDYYEYVYDFVTYSIKRIDYFITEQLISAFRFANNSERDPYYGESLYENLLEGKYSLYGLSSGVCETVVKVLGGISLDGQSSAASGLSGSETIAIGLTPDVMKEYHLYAHRIYFELPRQIYDYYLDSDVNKEKEEYDSYATLGFTLYISEEQIDGTRYIASDLYDLVTRVDGKNFIFLDYDFVSFWARRYMILMDYTEIDSISIEFSMYDLVGRYDFELTEDDNEKSIVTVTPVGECTETKLTEYIDEMDYAFVSLTELYNHYVGGGKPVYIDSESMGTTYFREALLGIFYTQYQDVMSKEDRSEAITPEKLLFKLTLDIKSSAYDYVYEFYRADDRRVLVRLYRQSAGGEMMGEAVDDFYISTFGFKKIVRSFLYVLNAEEFERDIPYPDED